MKFCFLLFLLSGWIWAEIPPTCRQVHLADIGWTDVSATTALMAELLQAKGYEPVVSFLSLPVALASLENHQIDVFMGNWMPTQKADLAPYLNRKTVIQLGKNLEGAKYTLAVPDYVYQAGVHSFQDLKRYEANFHQHIYGIEAGNDGNRQLLKMIDDNAFGLGAWKLVESSEQGMLTQVKQSLLKHEWVVLLGWAPHPMNLDIPLNYLAGGDNYFGPNYGHADVYTLTRSGLAQDCPELTSFLKKIHFNIKQENELMGLILSQKVSPQRAAQIWLGKNPSQALLWIGDLKNTEKYLFNVNNFSENSHLESIPIGNLAEKITHYLTSNFSKEFLSLSSTIESLIQWMISSILHIPALIFILCLSALLYTWRRSIKLGFGTCLGLMLILNLGLWVETIQTLVLVLLSTFIACFLGIPIGILAARNKHFYTFLKPVLDLMQTLPTFVYLIPTLMLFGLGIVPGLISTLIFAIAAPIRLAHLGISQVPEELIEAGKAFGASKWQRFWKIELPAAFPSILTGVNQCVLLSLSMVVIAALVGAEGLGTSVIRALNTVNLKQGFEAGLAIVILAIIIDRSLQNREGSL